MTDITTCAMKIRITILKNEEYIFTYTYRGGHFADFTLFLYES